MEWVVPMIKAIFFDLDGTLVEFPIRFLLEGTHRLLNKLGEEPIEESVVLDCFSDFDFFRFVRGKYEFSEEEFRVSFWKELASVSSPKGIPFPETVETLKRLKDLGFVLGIATARTSTPQEVMEDLTHGGLDSFFTIETIATRAHPEDNWKDKSPQINKLISYFSIEPEEAIIVGDIPSDITSGRECDLAATIAVQSGGIKKEVLESSEPDVVLLHLGDLPNFLIDFSE